MSDKAYFKHGGSKKNQDDAQTMTYKIRVHVDSHFGTPRAFVIRNNYKKKIFLQSAAIETSNSQIIYFDCNSWIYPNKKTKCDRLFFSNSVSLTVVGTDPLFNIPFKIIYDLHTYIHMYRDEGSV